MKATTILLLTAVSLCSCATLDISAGRLLSNAPINLDPYRSQRQNHNSSLPSFLIPHSNSFLAPLHSRSSSTICTENGPSCPADSFCYDGLGCCPTSSFGCGSEACCPKTSTCCGTSCCPSGYDCIEHNGVTGCCATGTDCKDVGDIVDASEGPAGEEDVQSCGRKNYGLCPSGGFCCPVGMGCLVDADGGMSCERTCADDGYEICPSNDFCCPKGSECWISSIGYPRCGSVVTSTVLVQPSSTSSMTDSRTTSASSSPSADSRTSTDTASNSIQLSSSLTILLSTSVQDPEYTTMTISSDVTVTVPPSETATVGVTVTAKNPVPTRNMGSPFDDINTNSNGALRLEGCNLVSAVVGLVVLMMML